MEGALDVVRELERRDDALGIAIAELEVLEAETEELRARAAAVEELRARLPDERRTLDLRIGESREELERRRAEERDAQAELELAEEKGDRERLAEARRAVVRAQDAASSAAKRLERAERLFAELEDAAAAAERDAPTLEQRAAIDAGELEKVPRLAAPPRPEPGLAAVVDWAGRARAALFVTRNATEREREAIVREANELGAATLGEPLFASSVAQLRRRLEESA